MQLQRQWVGDLRPIPTTAHGEHHIRTNIHDSLRHTNFVFIRSDARKSLLQTPYDGPFEVLERSAKHFKLRKGNQVDNVSIDRLKPAYLDQSQPAQVAQPPRRGRPPGPSTRSVHLPTDRVPPNIEENPSQQFLPAHPTYAKVTTRRGRVVHQPTRYFD